MMNNDITIRLPQKKKEQLQRLALRYGFSLAEFSRHILEELASEFPEESFADYTNPQELRASFQRGLKDWRAGRISSRL